MAYYNFSGGAPYPMLIIKEGKTMLIVMPLLVATHYVRVLFYVYVCCYVLLISCQDI
jgi:hypothetical protein